MLTYAEIICLIIVLEGQKAPETGELVIMGVTSTKPFMEVGIISGIDQFVTYM